MALGYFDASAGETQGDAKRRLANALLAGPSSAPRNLGEGLNELGKTLLGAMLYRQQQDATGAADARNYATVTGGLPLPLGGAGTASADVPFQPAAGPSADAAPAPAPQPGGDTVPALAQARAGFAQELQDQALATRLAAITQAEVGGQGPQAQQAFMESVLNRAAARGQTLAQTLTGGYFPPVTYQHADRFATDPQLAGRYGGMVGNVLGGSNVSQFATGNASGGVGFNGGPQVSAYGGERFGIEGPDRAWADRLRGGGQPAAAPVQVASLDPGFMPGGPGTDPVPQRPGAQRLASALASAQGPAAARDVSVAPAAPGGPGGEGMVAGAQHPLVQALVGQQGGGPAPQPQPQPQPAPQPPAATGAPVSQRAAQLYRVMIDQDASPQVRQMAAMQLQYELQPQYDFVTRPDGSVVAVNKRNPAQSVLAQGPMKTPAFKEIEDPSTGLKRTIQYDPVTGSPIGELTPNGLVPIGQNGGSAPQGAPAQGPGQVPPPPAGVDVKKYRERQADLQASENSPTVAQELEVQQKFAELPSYKEYSAALPTWNSFTQHVTDNTPAADKAIVDDFAKILNPGRAVTTGAFMLNMDAQSIPAKIQADIMKAWQGNGELGPDARAQMARVAQMKMQEYQRAWQTDADRGRKVLEGHHAYSADRLLPTLPDMAPLEYGRINADKTTAQGMAPGAPLSRPNYAPGGGASDPAQGLPRAQGPQDVQALPPGTRFVAPDGSVRIKQ
ncbi:hypothetical protein [Xanthobacter versatilis]|uniref:hypothetical protein n=1 Tax=Xanthobacter autotrophicus (strain ATCC BAA-1158 / Py2) TaxID=78245 RepID=UPI003729FB23